MNLSLISLEVCVITLGLVVLLADLWLPPERKKLLGYAAAAGLGFLLVINFTHLGNCTVPGEAFNGMFVQDALSIFFKRFFLLTAILVLLLIAEFSDQIAAGISEYYSLTLFALVGMLFAASANNFALLFVSLELITVSFYVLTSFQRGRMVSLEAGVKYLIIGSLSTSFTIFGIALVWGTSGKFNFAELATVAAQMGGNKLFLFGLLFVMVGLGFKIAAFPFQIWAPDVYQGAPTPTTAFLAVGSKAAGFVLLLRVLFVAVPTITAQQANILIIISGITILYGNLCAIPQHNIKRLLGYSSIAHAGYLLLGVAAMAGAKSSDGGAAILYYLSGYLFTLFAAFMVITLVLRHLDTEEISGLAGLGQRSPLLAATMTLSMVSLAGLPPMVGFFGKFLLLKSVIDLGPVNHGYYCLAFTALVGVVISIYYYFGVIRAIYWGQPNDSLPIRISCPLRFAICLCIVGMLWFGLFPACLLHLAQGGAAALGF
ncbi:MAG TPA: NADH-quinone oxidoreductase subunit N [Verrucomicrobiae bacterium]|jgi:NADH-quinone oxidoreductase subunit N|nr:NADH-quinone oxidoreductase subunit N [Verrucomicrobiae bacterium]